MRRLAVWCTHRVRVKTPMTCVPSDETMTCVPSDETRKGPGSCYPSIADNALIGDVQTAGLVAPDRAISWFSRPLFVSMYAALLDDRLDTLTGPTSYSERAARNG